MNKEYNGDAVLRYCGNLLLMALAGAFFYGLCLVLEF